MIIKKLRIILFVIVWIVRLYLIFVCISVILMSQMEMITYKYSSYGFVTREVIINFEDNSALETRFDFFDQLQQPEYIEKSFSKAKEFEIKTVCAFSLFPLWLPIYNNQGIMSNDYINIIQNYKSYTNLKTSIAIQVGFAQPITFHFVQQSIFKVLD